MADDEIIVAVDSDIAVDTTKTETPRGADGKFAKAETPADELVEQFRTQAETNRVRAETAERRAAEQTRAAEDARKEAASARTQVVDREYDTVTTGIEAAESEIASAKRDYKTASEAGDWDKQADATDRLAAARARQVRLGEAKADLEARKAKPDEPRKSEPQTEPRPQQADPVEAYCANRTEPTVNWLRAHTDWITDPKKNAKLTGAHFDAIGEGLSPDTREYFAHVETKLGIRDGNGAGNGNAPNKQIRRSAVPVAPVQASSGGTNGGGTEVRLSKGEAAAATDGSLVWNYDDPSPQKRFRKGDVIGVQELARRKLILTKQGAYDRTYTES